MTVRLRLLIPYKSQQRPTAQFVISSSLHYQFTMVNYYHSKQVTAT